MHLSTQGAQRIDQIPDRTLVHASNTTKIETAAHQTQGSRQGAKSRTGITQKQVGIAMRNCPSWVVSYMAIAKAGGVATLLNGWSADQARVRSEEHLEELGFLWGQWRAALTDADYTLPRVGELEERVRELFGGRVSSLETARRTGTKKYLGALLDMRAGTQQLTPLYQKVGVDARTASACSGAWKATSSNGPVRSMSAAVSSRSTTVRAGRGSSLPGPSSRTTEGTS